jgi:hypothetical protein
MGVFAVELDVLQVGATIRGQEGREAGAVFGLVLQELQQVDEVRGGAQNGAAMGTGADIRRAEERGPIDGALRFRRYCAPRTGRLDTDAKR